MSQTSERLEESDPTETEKEKKVLDALNTLPFGPCDIDPQAWKGLKLAVKAYSTGQNAVEVCFALLGEFRRKRFLIKEFVHLIGESSRNQCAYLTRYVKKIEKEANKERLMLIGFCHTHCDDSVTPSHADMVTWISSMLELNRPLFYYIISPNSLRVAAYSIPPEIFYQIKHAIKFIPFEARE